MPTVQGRSWADVLMRHLVYSEQGLSVAWSLGFTEEPPPLLHPEMARIYRTKVTALATALQESDTKSEATEALRGLVDGIVLTPDPVGQTLQIELRGNLAAMLGATVQTKRSSECDDLSLQVSLVAGAGFEPATFGL